MKRKVISAMLAFSLLSSPYYRLWRKRSDRRKKETNTETKQEDSAYEPVTITLNLERSGLGRECGIYVY